MFVKANEPEFPEGQLNREPPTLRFLPHFGWHWTYQRPWAYRIMLARWIHEGFGKVRDIGIGSVCNPLPYTHCRVRQTTASPRRLCTAGEL